MGDTLLPTIGGSSAVGPGRGGHPYWTTAGRWRGLGQCIPDPADPSTCYDVTGNIPSGTTPPTSPQAGGGGGAAGSGTQQQGINWTQVIQAAIKGTSTVVAQQTNPFAPKNIPQGTYYASGPGGTVISTAGAGSPYTAGYTTTAGITSSLTSMLPILLIGGVLVMMMGARR